MTVLENVYLAPLTTLKVGGPARYFTESKSAAEVAEAVNFARSKDLPLFVVGGAAANLVVSDAGWPGLVLKLAAPGIDERTADGKTLFDVGAGEEWDRFVARCRRQKLRRGRVSERHSRSVGGTPVQM